MAQRIHVHIHRAPSRDAAALAQEQSRSGAISKLVMLLLERIAANESTKTGDAGNWEESKHPRADNGQFGKGGGGGGPTKPAGKSASTAKRATPEEEAEGDEEEGHARIEKMYDDYHNKLATRGAKLAAELKDSQHGSRAGGMLNALLDQGEVDTILGDELVNHPIWEYMDLDAGVAAEKVVAAAKKALRPARISAPGGPGPGTKPNPKFNPRAEGPSEKPTKAISSGAKAATHELLSSGHPFSVDELVKATGASKASVMTALSDLKNPKYAGKLGALTIVKDKDGNYKVEKATGLAPKPGPDGNPMGKHPELAAAERRVAENPRTTGASGSVTPLHEALELAAPAYRGLPIPPEAVSAAAAYMEGKRNIDAIRLAEHAGISVGAAMHLKRARSEHFRAQGGSRAQTQAERSDAFLKQKHVGLIKR